jgi:hypothetical protein
MPQTKTGANNNPWIVHLRRASEAYAAEKAAKGEPPPKKRVKAERSDGAGRTSPPPAP